MTRVHVRIPHHLPIVPASYVTIDRKRRLNIHSKRRTLSKLLTESNVRRYNERKGRKRQARNGQLESINSDRLGIVAEAHHRNLNVNRIADAALVSRALGG